MTTRAEILDRLAKLDSFVDTLEFLRAIVTRPASCTTATQTEAPFVSECATMTDSAERVGVTPFCSPIAPVVGSWPRQERQEDIPWTQVVGRRDRRCRTAGSAMLPAGKVAAPVTSSPLSVTNRFGPLAGEESQPQDDEVVVVGDSIVRGLRLPSQKKATVFCYPGTRLEHVSQRVPAILSRSSQDPVVIAHLGGNNVRLDSARGVAERTRHLIRAVRGVRPGARVVISNILPRFDRAPGGRPVKRPEYQAAAWEVRQVCRQEGVVLVDATPGLLRDASRCFRPDGTHLTGRGLAVMGDAIHRVLVQTGGRCLGN